MAEFAALYAKPSNDIKVKYWEIKVEIYDDIPNIVRKHGYVDHKITTTYKPIENGKNIGKKNETTPLKQAIKEATSMWNKQKESGYSEQIENINNVQILPMLAHDYKKRHKDIKEPFYVQPKLDGVRVMANAKGDLISRTGKEYKGFDHITNAIKELKLESNVILDGELFTFDLEFEKITGITRQLKKKDQEVNKIKFYIFDKTTSNDSDSYQTRYTFLKNLKLTDPLVLVNSELLNNKSDIPSKLSSFLEQGYEGIMMRNINGIYKSNYRSAHLQKLKEFIDEEFEITGGESATGEDRDTVIFKCICKSGEFSVRPRGSREQRKQWLMDINNLIGKMLTVRYQNLTETGIPRFPVGITIRDYE